MSQPRVMQRPEWWRHPVQRWRWRRAFGDALVVQVNPLGQDVHRARTKTQIRKRMKGIAGVR